MTNRFTKIAAAAAVAAAVAVPSTQAFAATKTENALIGGVIGAFAGALLGHGDGGAVAAGAAAGALIGVATDKPDHRYVRAPVRRSSYRTAVPYRAYGQPAYRTQYVRDYGYRTVPVRRHYGY
jgi:hypothetical protein